MADSSKRLGQETLNLQMLGSSPTSVTKNMVPSNKWPVHRSFKPEMLGSSSRLPARSLLNTCHRHVATHWDHCGYRTKVCTSDCESEDMGSIVSSVDSVGAKRCPQGISTPLVTL